MCKTITLEMAQDALDRRGYLVVNGYVEQAIGQVIDQVSCSLEEELAVREMKCVIVARTTCADFLEQWKLFGQDPARWIDRDGLYYWRVLAE